MQVEPYLERLLEIHDYFAEGMTPDEVLNMSDLKTVYMVEKVATAALINYYCRSIEKDFNQVVQSVKAFAKSDAQRSKLRSILRAGAIASLDTDRRIYVEAGYIHYSLYRCLMHEVKDKKRVRAVYLMQPVFKNLRCKRRNMGPGDILTLNYALYLPIKEDQASLLAARSLIYTKLIQTEEMFPDRSNSMPHSLDEALVNRLADRLGFEDCKAIYSEIRFKNRQESINFVKSYVPRYLT